MLARTGQYRVKLADPVAIAVAIIAEFSEMPSFTKLDAAAENLRCAARLYFEGEHLIPVLTLANAAREIVATLGEKLAKTTMHQELAKKHGVTVEKLVAPQVRAANFAKHADRDPQAVLPLDDEDVLTLIYLTCIDFQQIANGLPVEAQVFQAWAMAIAFDKISEAPLRSQPLLRKLAAKFAGVRTAQRPQQKEIGLRAMREAVADPSLKMNFRREVVIPPTGRTGPVSQMKTPRR